MVKVLIWQARSARGLSLRELERRSGVSKTALQRIETEAVSPTLNQLDLIADALDCSISQLYRESKRHTKMSRYRDIFLQIVDAGGVDVA